MHASSSDLSLYPGLLKVYLRERNSTGGASFYNAAILIWIFMLTSCVGLHYIEYEPLIYD